MPPVLVPALAAGASTALAGGFGAAVAAGSIGAFAGGVSLAAVATSAGLAAASAGLQLATAKKSGGIAPTSSFVQRTPVYLPDVYGECRVGAAAAYYRQSTDASNNDLLTVWVLAGHPIEEISEIRYGDALMWTPSGGLEADFDGRATVAVQLGHDATPTPPADLLAGSSGVLDSDFKLKGKPYVYIRFSKVTGRKTKWPEGIDPGRLWYRVKGKRVWDPRTETTAYSANWALCFRDWLIARGGLSAAQFSEAQIIAAANLCDENVSLGGSPETFQNRYRVHGAFRSEVAPRELIGDWLRQGGNLRGLVNTGATLAIVPGSYTAPAATFGPDDFLEPVRLEPEAKVEDRYDGVRSTFAAPGRFYNATDANTVLLDDYSGAAEDARVLELEYARETSRARAVRLGLLALRQSRRVQKASFAVPLTAANAALLPGQRLNVSLPPAGISGVFEIVERRTVLDAERPRVEIVALEDDADFWGWTAETATAAPDGLTSTLPNPFFVAPPTSVTATSFTRVEPDGSVTRWIDVEWTAPAAEPYIDRYRVEWTQGGETRDAETTATRYRINNLAASGSVAVTVFTVNTLGRESAGAAPGAAVTPGGDATPPGPPPSGAIFPVAGGFRFLIGNPTDADLAGLRLYEGAAGAAFGATSAVLDVAATPGGQDTAILRQGIAAGTTRRFFVTAFDRTGNESTAFGPLQATTPTELTPEEIDEAISDAVSIATAAEADAAAALAAAAANGTDITQLQTDATALTAAFAAGQTTNAVRNSGFTLGADYWTFIDGSPDYTFGRRVQSSIYSGATDLDRPLFLARAADAADQQARIVNMTARAYSGLTGLGVPTKAGTWVEAAAHLGVVNCAAQLQLVFRDAAGAILSTHSSALAGAAVSGDPAGAPRLSVVAQAPAGAAKACLVGLMGASTVTSSEAILLLHRPQLRAAQSGTEPLAPYAPGAVADVGTVDAYYRQDVAVLAEDGLAVAQAVESQGARLDDAEADITTIQTTKVDASGAVAAVNATVSAASVSGVATVNQLTLAYAELDEDVRAFDILTVEAGGSVARRTLGAAPSGSFITFDANLVRFEADKFQIANPGGGSPQTIFEVEGGAVVIDGNLYVKGESITTGKIGANQVTRNYEASGTALNSSAITVSMNRAGEIVASVARALTVSVLAGTATATLRLLIDGVLVASQSISTGGPAQEGGGEITREYIALSGKRNVGSGSRVVRVEVTVSGGTSPSVVAGPFVMTASGFFA